MFKHIYSFIDKVKSKLSQKGQGMVEYALIIAFVAAIAAFALNGGLKNAVSTAFSDAAQAISDAKNPPTTTGDNDDG